MATQNIPISTLPIAVGLDGSEIVPIVQGGVTKRTTITTIAGEVAGFVPTSRRINTVNGIAGGGTLQNDLTLRLDIFDLAQKTVPTVQDWLAMNDGSSTTPVKVAPSDYYKTIVGLTEKTVPSTNDFLVLYSMADADSRKIDVANLGLAFGGVPTGGTTGQGLVKQSNTNFDSVWGVLPLVGGGTGTALTGSLGGIVYSTATQLEILAGTAVADRIVLSGASNAPSWSTATYPATIAAGSVLLAGTANVIAGTPTPTLGVSGSVGGSIAFAGVTSGSVLLTPQPTAGTVTLTLPNTSGTVAASATGPITLDPLSGVIGITPSALTGTSDTNVTISFGEQPSVALVNPANIVMGWAGQLSPARGGTGLPSGTPGGILGFTAPTTIASSVALTANALVLGGGASALPTPMSSLGTSATVLHGNATGAPTFGPVDLTTDVSNILPVANGGTGLSSGTSGGILTFTATNAVSSSAALALDAIVLGGGAGATPFTLGTLGTTTTVLHGNPSGAPTFGAVVLTTDVSGILPRANGGTGLSATAAGTVLGSTAANVIVATSQPTLGVNGGTGGQITLFGATSGSAVIAVAAAAGATNFRLPVGNGGAGQALITDGAGNLSYTASVAGSVTSVSITAGTGITQSGSPITTSGAITVNVDKATAANYYAATANKVVTTDIIYPTEVTVTFGATTTFDFSTFVSAVVTLTGNITTQTLANIIPGKSGTIRFIQDASGSRTTVWNSNFKFSGGGKPILSTAPNAVDVLSYDCITSTFILASLIPAVA